MRLTVKLGRNAPRLAHNLSPKSNTRQFSSTLIQPHSSSPTPESKSEPSPKIIFSGIQPTGVPHLGNYLGALKQWKDMQDAAHPSDKLFFSIVDLHALTIPGNADKLRRNRREMLTSLLAIGLDPERSAIFYQSSVSQHAELQWILSCTASTGYLSPLKHGLFSYPILQAADILLHQSTHVPVGSDQKQHLEFARECVTNFHSSWSIPSSSSRPPIFRYPQTISLDSSSSRIMSLSDPTKKMSKSDPVEKSKIFISDDEGVIRAKIKSALTDSVSKFVGEYDSVNRPGVANLLEILAGFSGGGERKTGRELAEELKGESLLGLKTLTADAVVKGLAEVREKFRQFGEDTEQNKARMREIEDIGTRRARESAERTMERVREAIGLA
ncbi:hypothetical protein B0T21DRAFT_364354 [Apiosordaria backusii]|uniref:tryptophan--tRNA ligase n=1 Tax=Apiosordaria backusii TaxID=314023 RepID=A0AA40BMS0_9PEZI|nr:hypothetical protein B0T21DRAFT_364354 [Apiosordaria backusii]